MAASAPISIAPSLGALSRISVRERRLLLVLLLAGLAIAPLMTFNMRRKAQDENVDAHAALTTARLNARRATGAGLAGQIEETKKDIQGWSYTAPSVPVGQVTVQNRMGEIAATAGLVGAETRAMPKVQPAGPVTFAPVEVIAPFSWSGLSGFLNGVSGTGKGFILDSVTLTEDKDPKLKVALRLPLVIETPAPESAKP